MRWIGWDGFQTVLIISWSTPECAYMFFCALQLGRPIKWVICFGLISLACKASQDAKICEKGLEPGPRLEAPSLEPDHILLPASQLVSFSDHFDFAFRQVFWLILSTWKGWFSRWRWIQVVPEESVAGGMWVFKQFIEFETVANAAGGRQCLLATAIACVLPFPPQTFADWQSCRKLDQDITKVPCRHLPGDWKGAR